MEKAKIETLIRNCLSRKLSVQKIDSLAPMIAEYLADNYTDRNRPIRCKDCRYWDAVKNQKYKGVGVCNPPNRSLGGYCTRRGATTENDFCSFAVPKKGECIK